MEQVQQTNTKKNTKKVSKEVKNEETTTNVAAPVENTSAPVKEKKPRKKSKETETNEVLMTVEDNTTTNASTNADNMEGEVVSDNEVTTNKKSSKKEVIPMTSEQLLVFGSTIFENVDDFYLQIKNIDTMNVQQRKDLTTLIKKIEKKTRDMTSAYMAFMDHRLDQTEKLVEKEIAKQNKKASKKEKDPNVQTNTGVKKPMKAMQFVIDSINDNLNILEKETQDKLEFEDDLLSKAQIHSFICGLVKVSPECRIVGPDGKPVGKMFRVDNGILRDFFQGVEQSILTKADDAKIQTLIEKNVLTSERKINPVFDYQKIFSILAYCLDQ